MCVVPQIEVVASAKAKTIENGRSLNFIALNIIAKGLSDVRGVYKHLLKTTDGKYLEGHRN